MSELHSFYSSSRILFRFWNHVRGSPTSIKLQQVDDRNVQSVHENCIIVLVYLDFSRIITTPEKFSRHVVVGRKIVLNIVSALVSHTNRDEIIFFQN